MPLFLTSLTSLRTVLGAKPSDDELEFYGEAAEAAVKKYCDRDFESQSYTQYYSGNNTQRLALRQTPVTAVASVHVDSHGYFGLGVTPFSSLTQLTDGRDYVLDADSSPGVSKSGVLLRIGTVWPMLNRVLPVSRLAPEIGPAFGNIKVTYTAGYDEAPADLKFATTMLAAYMRRIAALGGTPVRKETIGDYSYELFERVRGGAPELGSINTTLARYKEYGW